VPELYDLTIAEAGRGLAGKAFSPVELVGAVLARAEATEPKINAFITRTAERALEMAAASERRYLRGEALGPLDGIPLAYKDIFDTAGVRTTAGSRLLGDRVPDTDATAVARLRAAGAVMVGKVNTHEFAMGATTINPHYGPTRNPWNTEHIPGGSSGGSGAAVAAGSALGALGSDTGGSIRMPSCLCGISGIKPTYGRVSRAGVYPLSWSLDHAGPMARTAEDCALLLKAIAGQDPRDPGSSPEPVPDYTAGFGRDLRGRRLGLPRELFTFPMEPEVERAVRVAVGKLEELGAETREVELGVAAQGRLLVGPIVGAEHASVHEDWTPEEFALIGADIQERIRSGRLYRGAQFGRAPRARTALRRDLRAALEGLDALVLSTMPMVAPRIEGPIDMAALSAFMGLFNVSGFPALSVPCGFGAGGLPVGLQIAGRPYEEGAILAIAHAYQAATDWHLRRPPL
jgi:aspartyl-tRNA(Asn)/glutamyl-tRNA(Gln) amidotransferase subunit A